MDETQELEEKIFDLFMDIQIKQYKSQPLAGEYTKEALELIVAHDSLRKTALLEAFDYPHHSLGCAGDAENDMYGCDCGVARMREAIEKIYGGENVGG